MKKLSASLFVVILFSFSAVMLVFSLLASIRIAALNDTAARLQKETAVLTEENEILLAQYEQLVSIDEIERYAVEELGMQHCKAEQMETIVISEPVK